MYLDFLVEVPDVQGKITTKVKGDPQKRVKVNEWGQKVITWEKNLINRNRFF